jgi:hypothetical protein
MSKVPLKQPEHFWNVDLLEVSREWLSQLWTFCMTALTFAFMALPILIATLILWYLAGFPRLTI